MIRFKQADSIEGCEVIEQLAHTIWREHYIPIIGKAQVDYMLDKFQSTSAIQEQIDTGFEYFWIEFESMPVGYMAYKLEKDSLFLSKIYVLASYRGRKIGAAAMHFVEEQAKRYGLKTITLTVNKNNHKAINAYLSLGFVNLGSVVAEIGNGFVMDDFKMAKTL